MDALTGILALAVLKPMRRNWLLSAGAMPRAATASAD
jgi:hypothetical protein